MSYNVDSTQIANGELFIRGGALDKWLALEDKLPEVNFITCHDVCLSYVGDNWYRIDKFWWYSSGSGNTYFQILPAIIEDLKGEAQVVFTWERGAHVSGLRIKDGKATEHNKVDYTFLDEGKPFGGSAP